MESSAYVSTACGERCQRPPLLCLFIPEQVLIYLGKGRLPWQGIKATNKKQRYERICEVKMRTRSSVGQPMLFFGQSPL